MSVILATAGYDHKIRFWEAPSGICSRTLRYPDSQVNCLEITPDKRFLAAGGNPHIRLFEINTSSSNSSGGSSGPNSGNGNSHNGGGVNQNNNNSNNQNPVLQCDGHTSSVTAIGFQRDGRWMYSSSEDHTVKIWDLRSSTYSRSFDSGAPVNSVSLHPNQTQIVSGDQNGSVKIWDLGAGSNHCINELLPDSSSNHSSNHSSKVNLEPNENTNNIKNAKIQTGNGNGNAGSTAGRGGGRAPIQAVDVSEDGRLLLAASNRADVYLWDPSNMYNLIPLRKFRAHPLGSYLLHAKISPDGRHLVTTSSDKTALLWDTQSGECTKTLRQHQCWVWDAVFSADSSYLVTACSDHWARLWSLRSGEVVRQYTGHQSAVTCVALNDSST